MFTLAQGVIQAILSGVQAVVDAILEIVPTLVSAMQAMLNAEWNIPFVSQLYSYVTNGGTLTTINLFALIAAIPTTVLYKCAKGQAPFASQADVNNFTNLFDSQSMLQASGVGQAAQPRRRRPPPTHCCRPTWHSFFRVSEW